MNIAFYAPMKSPHSPRPSGDRKIAALFMSALERTGFNVSLASELRSWEGTGAPALQESIRNEAVAVAEKLIQRYRDMPIQQRPHAWFTYHLYHKAPDWIGPLVCGSLRIPYFLAEASIGLKQAGGAWDLGYQSSIASIQLANAIFSVNPVDTEGLRILLGNDSKLTLMRPFLDAETVAESDRIKFRNSIAAKLKIDPDKYWLLSVAMMRNDSKLKSYELLANAVEQLQRKDWLLLLIGDGPAELLVREYFRFDLDRRVYFLGKRNEEFIREVMGASDVLIWPAINEAIGMVALESLAYGLPVIWGRSGAIDQIVDDGCTGILIDHPDSASAAQEFANNIEALLSQPQTLAALSAASLQKFSSYHRIETASNILAQVIRPFLKNPD
jgi:glycosyltransferase involved in cell wall biosynthesis